GDLPAWVRFTTRTMRIAILVSSFEWSAFARSFDGARLDTVLPGNLPLAASWLYPTQGGWEEDFNESMTDVRVASLAITAPKGRYLANTELQGFLHHYADERNCSQRVDNTGKTATRADIDVTALGLHLLGVRPVGENQWDYTRLQRLSLGGRRGSVSSLKRERSSGGSCWPAG
ncbi:MAG: hypothetical protein ACLFRP_05730, partial [Puniceicoccaceae bacterium]